MKRFNFNWTSAPTPNINGGVVTNADAASQGKVNNAINNVILTNGTLTATTGERAAVAGYAAWNGNGSITSVGNAMIMILSGLAAPAIASPVAPVPEPGTLALIAVTALAGIGIDIRSSSYRVAGGCQSIIVR